MIRFKKSLLSTVIVASTLSTSPSFAKDSEIESITVTARHQEERIIDVPMAISTISDMEISDRNYTDATDLYRTLAGAAMVGNEGQLILRGLSGGNSGTPDTTTTFVDDVPFDFTNLIDVERVEILRGPQGTLYGSNAIGGTVRIITKKPVFDEFEFFGSAQATGEKNVSGLDNNFSAGVNIPLIDESLALRVTGNYEKDNYAFENINTGIQSESESGFIRSKLLWQATKNIDLTFGFARVEESYIGDTLGDGSRPRGKYQAVLTPNNIPGHGYDVDFYYLDCPLTSSRAECMSGEKQTGIKEKYQLWDLIDPELDSSSNLITLNINDKDLFGLASVVYAGSFRRYKETGIDNWSRLDAEDMFETWIVNKDDTDHTTHELRFQNIDSGQLSWTAGIFYNKEESKDVEWQAQYHSAGDETSAIAEAWWYEDVTKLGIETFNNPQKNWSNVAARYYQRELSFFGDASYNLNLYQHGSLEFSAGVRHFNFKDSFNGETAGIWSEGTTANAGEESGNRYKYSISYRPNRDLSIYALYSEGYRPGGNNAPLSQSCKSDPSAENRKDRFTSDSVENYEIGIKSSAFENKFNYSLAVYQIDWTDIRTSIYMDSCGFEYMANAGEAVSKGVEFESSTALTSDLAMTLNASYINAKVTEDNESISAKSGDDMTMVPDVTAYIALDYGYKVFNKQAYLRVDANYYGEYKTHFNVREEDKVPSYSVVNLSGRFEISDEINISIHLNNLFNNDAYSYKGARSRDDSDTAAQEYIQFLPERNLTLRVDYTFM